MRPGVVLVVKERATCSTIQNACLYNVKYMIGTDFDVVIEVRSQHAAASSKQLATMVYTVHVDVRCGAGPHLDVQLRMSQGYLTEQQRGCTSSQAPRPPAVVVSHRTHGVHQIAR